jgi:hypothetical protein
MTMLENLTVLLLVAAVFFLLGLFGSLIYSVLEHDEDKDEYEN